jgi:type I restriction enzyme S subunit
MNSATVEEWVVAILDDDIVDIKTGKLDSNCADEKGKYPFFTCAPSPVRINEFAFDCEAILLAGNNADGIFHLNYCRGKFNAYQRTYVITVKNEKKLDLRYLYYHLQLSLNLLRDFSQGTSTKFLTMRILKDLEINLPSIEEQKKISKTLSDLDEKIRASKQMNENLEAIGQAVFKRWFVDFEYPNEEGKPYKSSGGEMVYSSALDKEIPAKWVAKEIGELAKINELSINRDFKYSEIEYIDIDSVDQGVIRNPQIVQLTDAPSRAKRIVKNQDIIISTVRPNLKHFAFIQKAKPNTIVSTGFAVITPNKGNSKFLYYHLTADKYTNYLSAIADSHTSTYPSFNPDIIQKSMVAYPGEKEQAAANLPSLFDSILEGLFCKIENNSKQIATLSQLRDILLPKLLSGKIRVPVTKQNVEAT